ncbi:unnamed protein product [Closterium sp. NIES-54]
MVTTTTPGGQRVSICTCTRTGRQLATFTRRPWSSLYTLATDPPQVAASTQVSASSSVAPPCSCRILSHQTLLWHHRLRHPSLPHLHGMHSRLLVSGPPRSLPPLLPSHAPPCLPCVVGWQRATPHSSSFPPTAAPLQTLHMDVWGPARVNGQSRERYFLLVVDDYTPSPASRASFAVRYVAHQLNHCPRVSLPETSPTLRWTGGVGDASVFWVWGSRAFVRDTSADKLSACANSCVFLGLSPDAPGWQFYHPTSRRAFPSQDVKFDESVPFYRLFPYRSAPPPTLPLFLAPGPPPVDPLPPRGLAPSGVSHVDPLPGTVLVELAVGSGAAQVAASGGATSEGAEPGGAESEGAGWGGAEPGGAEPGGAEPGGVEPGGAESEGAESTGSEPCGTDSSGGPAGASPRLSPRPEPLSPQQLRDWFAQRTRLQSGAGVSAAGDTGAGGVGVTAGAGGTGAAAAVGPGGARTRGTGAAGTSGVGGAGAGGAGAGNLADLGGAGAVGSGAGGAGAGDTGVVGAGAGGSGAGGAGSGRARAGDTGTVYPGAGGARAGGAVSGGTGGGGTPASPLPAPSPYTELPGGPTERREPLSRPSSPVCSVLTGRRVSRPRPPPVPGTHAMALRPSSVPLLPPPESSLLASTAASALVAELVHYTAACCLDYATALVAESESASPPSVGGECALGTDVLEDKQEDLECLAAAVPRFASMLLAPEGDPDAPDIPTLRSYAEAITGPYSSQWQAAMDAKMASWKSTGTYVDAVPLSRANIVDGMWIFRVKRPPGSPPAFKAHYIARGFSQRQGVDYFQTFSPTPKMTTLWVLLHVAA